MNERLIKLEKTYWNISEVIGVLFTLIKYHMWTDPFNILKAVLIIVVASIVTFIAINIIDLIVGVISGIIKYVGKEIKNRRLLKGFYSTNNNEENE